MTDRLKGVLVVFEQDIREDDAVAIVDAIKMIRHVLDVRPMIADTAYAIARMRVKNELREKIWALLSD